MKDIKFYNVKIKNWDKWNGGKKTTSWFKLSTSFPHDPKIMTLNNSEFRIYVSLLALAGHSQSNEVSFSNHSLTIGWQLRRHSLTTVLSKLVELQLIEIQKERKKERERGESKLSSKEKTKPRKKEGQKYTKEFEELWEKWPPNNGSRGSKTAAFKNLVNWAEAHSLEKAYQYAQNYLDFNAAKKIDMPYRLSNFFGSLGYWEDFTRPKRVEDSSDYDPNKPSVPFDPVAWGAKF